MDDGRQLRGFEPKCDQNDAQSYYQACTFETEQDVSRLSFSLQFPSRADNLGTTEPAGRRECASASRKHLLCSHVADPLPVPKCA